MNRRQLCWAHVKRDFQKIVDRGGASVWVGRRGLVLIKKVFAAWHAFRAERSTREHLQAEIGRLANHMNKLLQEGSIVGTEQRVVRFCDRLVDREAALWTFARVEGVEPTNNHMERLLRRAVLWRKRSFGCASGAGCRFVEQIVTVVQTRRLQGKSVLDSLHDTLRAARAGQACPKLLVVG